MGERYPGYELFTLFAAYTGLRAEELAGLEVADLAFTPAPVPASQTAPVGVRGSVNVRRAKKRRGGQWVTDTLKSAKSARTVPLPPWLAERMAHYLAPGAADGHPYTHPRANEPTAPLWPNRALGGARRRGCKAVAPLDYTEPIDTTAFYKNVLRPALAAVGLPASRPARPVTATQPAQLAVEGVRLHDLRYTFAALQLSAGVHFMQVSQWLGHSTYTLTLDVYGDWIPEQDGGVANTLPEPTTSPQANATVVPLWPAR